MALDDSGERFHELDHFGLPAQDESLAFGFLEILVEFSHAKTMILVNAGEAGPKFRTVFSRESCGEFQKCRYSCARFLRKTPPPRVGGCLDGIP